MLEHRSSDPCKERELERFYSITVFYGSLLQPLSNLFKICSGRADRGRPCIAGNGCAPRLENKRLSLAADDRMRGSYSSMIRAFMSQQGVPEPRQIVDLGCATGLSTLELQKTFPAAEIVGLDMSPYFLAVAKVLQRQRREVHSPPFPPSPSPRHKCQFSFMALSAFVISRLCRQEQSSDFYKSLTLLAGADQLWLSCRQELQST